MFYRHDLWPAKAVKWHNLLGNDRKVSSISSQTGTRDTLGPDLHLDSITWSCLCSFHISSLIVLLCCSTWLVLLCRIIVCDWWCVWRPCYSGVFSQHWAIKLRINIWWWWWKQTRNNPRNCLMCFQDVLFQQRLNSDVELIIVHFSSLNFLNSVDFLLKATLKTWSVSFVWLSLLIFWVHLMC